MSTKKKQELNFEKAIKRLEEIVSDLEADEIDLDKSLELYEEGVKLSRFCNEKISDAERKIEILKNGGQLIKEIKSTGKVETKPDLELFNDL